MIGPHLQALYDEWRGDGFCLVCDGPVPKHRTKRHRLCREPECRREYLRAHARDKRMKAAGRVLHLAVKAMDRALQALAEGA